MLVEWFYEHRESILVHILAIYFAVRTLLDIAFFVACWPPGGRVNVDMGERIPISSEKPDPISAQLERELSRICQRHGMGSLEGMSRRTALIVIKNCLLKLENQLVDYGLRTKKSAPK